MSKGIVGFFGFWFVLLVSGHLCVGFEANLPGLGTTDFSFTESAIYRYFTDEEYVQDEEEGKDYEFINRLNLRVTNRDYILGLRFDVDINTKRDEEYRLEKKFFQINKPSFTLEVGDYYYSMGRGLVLNIVKTFEDEGLEYQIEQTVLGGRVTLRGSRLEGTVLGGILEDEEIDIRDTIGGGNIAYSFANGTLLGLNLVGVQLDDSEKDDREIFQFYDQGAIGSITLQIPTLTAWSSFYFEFAGVMLQPEEEQKEFYNDLNGWGAYLETALYLNDWTILFEGKRYYEFIFPYHNPPLLEPEEIEVLAEQFILHTSDISGISLRVDYSFPGTSSILYGVYGYIDDSPDESDLFGTYQTYVHEYYLGFDSIFGNDIHLLSSVGYRDENNSILSPSQFAGVTPHAFFALKVPLFERHALELGGKWKHFTENAERSFDERYEFYRQEFSLGYHFSPYLSVIGTYEYYNDVRAQQTGGLSLDQNNYYSGSIIVHPIPDVYLKFFYGSSAGGIKCSSGVCKSFPPFEGLRTELVIRF